MEKLSQDEKELVRLGREVEAMMATAGWHQYVKLLNSHIEMKSRDVLRPFTVRQEQKATQAVMFGALDAFVTAAEEKGAIVGLSLARDMPSSIVQTMKEILARLTGEDDSDE